MTTRVVVDAANLVAGGGVQVGASLIDELAGFRVSEEWILRYPWLARVEVRASPAVMANLRSREDRSWITQESPSHPWSRRTRGRDVADVVFEVFGPVYRPLPAHRRITGFADITSLVPEMAGADGIHARTRLEIRRRLSRRCYSRAHRVVVEAGSTGGLLKDRWHVSPEKLVVVPNVVNGVFTAGDRGEAPEGIPSDVATFCYITRAYAHKNLRVLGPAVAALRQRWGHDARVVLTLTEDEFAALDHLTRDVSVNLGPQPIVEVPAIYRACTGTVFTSLLECFSVTPLEAMACGSSLVASDRDFVRDVAGEAAFYVDPLSPRSIAEGMARVLDDGNGREERRERGYQIFEEWPQARDRAGSYVQLMDAELSS